MKNDTASPQRKTKRISPLRRSLLLLLSGLVAVLSAPLNAANEPRLYVFANADMRAHTLEKELESVLPGVDVTVFSRVREFEVALDDRPEGTLSRKAVLESFGRRIDLQGYSGSSPTEPFVLMSNNTALTVKDLQGKSLGAVDILGRKSMDDFIGGILGSPSPKLKHVTHERDLLSLLQFDTVAAVITSESWANLIRSKSEMQLKTTRLPNEVGLAAVSFSSAQAKVALESKIKAAGGKFNQALGVTQWR